MSNIKIDLNADLREVHRRLARRHEYEREVHQAFVDWLKGDLESFQIVGEEG